LLVFITVVACDDSRRSGPVAIPAAHRSITLQDSINRGLVRPHGSVAVSVGANATASLTDPVSIVSLTPSNHLGFDQTQTIVGITSGPVQTVTVVGSGAIYCSGEYGTLIGYDSSGTILGQTALSLIDESDCSPPDWPDNVTFGAKATLTVAAGTIMKFEITPMSPLVGPVWDPLNQVYLTGHFYQNYGIGVKGPPSIQLTCASGQPRGGDVSCTASSDDPNKPLTIIAWSFKAAITNDVVVRTVNICSAVWGGKLAANGEVTVQGTIDGVERSKTASVTVQARTWAPDTTDKDFKVDSPANLPAKPTADSGQLGSTAVDLPIQVGEMSEWGVIIDDEGPNQNFVYLTKYPIKTKTWPAVNTTALSDTSQFYRIQYPKKTKVGAVMYCERAYVIGIIPLIEQHEGTDPTKFTMVPNNQNKTVTQYNSHSAIFRRHVDTQSSVNVRFEKVVGPSTGPVVGVVVDSIFREADGDSRAMDGDSRNVVTAQRMGCDQFTHDYTRSP
jgi:hypothetical protein